MKTLIVYASKHGTTEKCAELLSEKLNGETKVMNVCQSAGTDLATYDCVIIGGSIYAGMIQKEIKEFCQQNLNTLKTKRIGLFICSMMKKSEQNQINAAFPKELLDTASIKENFGGELRFSDMNFMEKTLTKMVSKMVSKDDPTLKVDGKQDVSLLMPERLLKFASAIG